MSRYFLIVLSYLLISFTALSGSSDFFLPDDHPLKYLLDNIFSEPTVLDNSRTFQESGFVTVHRQPTGMRVASHPLLPGFLIKTYLSSERKKMAQNWNWMIERCEGARQIRNLIQNENMRYFTVPDKWVYVLPNAKKKNMNTQTAVPVVTDMKLVSLAESREAWLQATPNHLEELYSILLLGYESCTLPTNLAYTEDHTFACIDTAPTQCVLNLKRASQYLSKEMEAYWHTLMRKGS